MKSGLEDRNNELQEEVNDHYEPSLNEVRPGRPEQSKGYGGIWRPKGQSQ